MRLIDADALINSLTINPEECPGCPEPEWIEAFIDLLDIAPTVEERKTGTWNMYYRMHWRNTFVCNRCGSCFIVIQGENEMNFCPNCGAIMNGGM